MFVVVAPLAWAESGRKSSDKPDRGTRQTCERQLRSPIYDSYGKQTTEQGYSNSYEQDQRRFQPGPDEVEDRNPDENDAHNPGGF